MLLKFNISTRRMGKSMKNSDTISPNVRGKTKATRNIPVSQWVEVTLPQRSGCVSECADLLGPKVSRSDYLSTKPFAPAHAHASRTREAERPFASPNQTKFERDQAPLNSPFLKFIPPGAGGGTSSASASASARPPSGVYSLALTAVEKKPPACPRQRSASHVNERPAPDRTGRRNDGGTCLKRHGSFPRS